MTPTRLVHIAVVLLLLALPGSAQAAVEVSYSFSGGLNVVSDIPAGQLPAPAAANEGMEVERTLSPDSYDVKQLRPTTFEAGPGCAIVPDPPGPERTFVRCLVRGSADITASLRDGDDTFSHNPFVGSVGIGRMYVTGGNGNDRISGGAERDTLNGEAGNDDIYGGGNADVLRGGLGDDRFEGDLQWTGVPGDPNIVPGTDLIFGQSGNDTFTAGGNIPAPDHFDGGDGRDAASYVRRNSGVSLTATVSGDGAADDGQPGEGDDLDNVETLAGGDGRDEIVLTGTLDIQAPGGYTLIGGGDDDTLTVTRRVHTTIIGDGGDEFSDDGADTIRGGLGADTILARDGLADSVDCGGWLDSVEADLLDAVSANCEDVEVE